MGSLTHCRFVPTSIDFQHLPVCRLQDIQSRSQGSSSGEMVFINRP